MQKKKRLPRMREVLFGYNKQTLPRGTGRDFSLVEEVFRRGQENFIGCSKSSSGAGGIHFVYWKTFSRGHKLAHFPKEQECTLPRPIGEDQTPPPPQRNHSNNHHFRCHETDLVLFPDEHHGGRPAAGGLAAVPLRRTSRALKATRSLPA